MKFVLINVMLLVVVGFSTTSSQPTYDLNQVSCECGCDEEIEMLQRQINLLENKVDNIVSNRGQTKTQVLSTPTPTTTPRSLLFLSTA